ncbi:WD40-repeat-containing domain protein [Xylogone sp. PMI_703]|nr:WD40-repeat-containing domain protein [Xylogone sp. PMI_703]
MTLRLLNYYGYSKATQNGSHPWCFRTTRNCWPLRSDDSTIRVWDTARDFGTIELQQNHLDGSRGEIKNVAFSHDLHLLAGISWRHRNVLLWNTQDGRLLDTFRGHANSIKSIAFSHDSCWLASGSYDHTVRLWDVENGKLLRTFEGHTDTVHFVTFSHNSQLLASASHDGSTQVWNPKTGERLCKFEGHTNRIYFMAFSQDARQLATASEDCTVRLWSVETGQSLRGFKGHWDSARQVVMSHDSQLLASSSRDKTVKLWNTETGELLQTWWGVGEESLLAFSRDSRWLAFTEDNEALRLWDIKGSELKTLNIGCRLWHVSFDSNPALLRTDIGALCLQPPVVSTDYASVDTSNTCTPHWSGYGLSSDKSWITWNGKNVLWLPAEYRHEESATTERGIGIWCRPVLFFMLKFSPEKTPPL